MVHDVFISAKSADYEYARQLYKFLADRGVRVFFSPESLPELGNSDYRKEIDKKLDETQHMVVVASALEHASSPWVEAEWGFFISEKRSGRKSGNLVTVIVDSLDISKLPASLRYYEVISFDPSAFEKILRYVRPSAHLGKLEDQSPVAAVEPPSPRPRRSVEAFTNSLGNRMVRVPKERMAKGDGRDRPLYVATTCVSNRDYLAFVRDGGPSPAVNPPSYTHQTWNGRQCPASLLDHPVIFVTHEGARQFCDWLTQHEQKEGVIETNEHYSLPTFEQWRAVAAGLPLTPQTILGRAWDDGQIQPTQPVASGEPSALGLFHVIGNVFEWCLDVRLRNVRRSDGRLLPKTPCCISVGGGWASDFRWLEESVQKREYGAILCPGGWSMKDGGFRIWFEGT